MPVLHKYKDDSGYFIKANIKGSIVTFQLTESGYSRLIATGVDDNGKFLLQLLVDLVRSGEAYTGGTGTTPARNQSQLEFDFKPAPEVESLFPRCSRCASFDDLRLVLLDPSAEILCEQCVLKHTAGMILANIPIPILTSGSLDILIAQGKIGSDNECVKLLKEWFSAEMSRFWEEYSIQKKNRQTSFDFPAEGKLF
jgi:hypothetical protein